MADDIIKAQNLAQTMSQPEALPQARSIDESVVIKATQTLKQYQDKKEMLTLRLKGNENWWRLRHWRQLDEYGERTDERPTSGWLFNVIISKHAELMQAYPTFNCLPREQDDKEEARRLSEILPVVLEQNNFEQIYSEVGQEKLENGTGIYGVFWDKSKLNGLGDISITSIDPLSLYWEPGVKDIQASKNVFYTQNIDNDTLLATYPQLEGKIGGREIFDEEYKNEESQVDDSERTSVVDWYYKKTLPNGRTVLHYAKFCNDVLLFSSENEPDKYPDGWYAHGKYPFVFDVLFPSKGSIAGFGYIDVCRDPQKYIDLVGQAVTKSAMMGAMPRFFVREDGNVNEDEFVNWTKPIVHVEGNLGDDSIRQIQTAGLDGMYLNYINSKIDEMKETAGNRDVANGGTTSGVTAASAVAALQEASGKVSKDSTKAAYRAYKKVVEMCIELVRQFYDLPRQFRITGRDGVEKFVEYNNAGIQPSPIEGFDGQIGMRIPVFDLEISAQEETAYTKLSQNELALQFYQLGFFNPNMVDQALMCIDMMDFKGKTELVQKLQMYQTLQQQLMMWQQMAITMAQKYNDPMVLGLLQATGQAPAEPMPTGEASAPEQFTEGKKEGKHMEKARAAANESYMP